MKHVLQKLRKIENVNGFVSSVLTAVTFGNLIPFIQIHLYRFETIIQNLCLKEFDDDHFAQK